jgi:hypothetical protein
MPFWTCNSRPGEVMQKYLCSNDRAMFNDLHALYVESTSRIPRLSPAALKTVMQQMAKSDPGMAK